MIAQRRAQPDAIDAATRGVQLLQRMPPDAIACEISVVGAMLINDDDHALIDAVRAILPSGECFFHVGYGALYDVLLAVYDECGVVDTVLVLQRSSEMFGRWYEEEILTAAESVPCASHAVLWAREVRRMWVVRRTIEQCVALLADCHRHPDQIDDVLRDHRAAVDELMKQTVSPQRT